LIYTGFFCAGTAFFATIQQAGIAKSSVLLDFLHDSGLKISITAAIHFILADLFPFVTHLTTDLPPLGMVGLNLMSFRRGIINMTTGTLTRADIAASINQQVGLSRNEAAGIVESILDHMTNALAEGENVKISGFGTFVLRDKAERVGRNPKTGVEVPILPRRVMTFRASQTMRARVSGC
jgi:integration host factor subunit alpha